MTTPLDERLEAFSVEMNGRFLRAVRGRRTTADRGPLYRRYAELSNTQTLRLLADELAGGTGDPAEELRRLRSFAARLFIDRHSEPARLRLNRAVAVARIAWDDDELGLEAARRCLGELEHAADRRRLGGRIATAARALQPAFRAYWEERHRAAELLGCSDYAACGAAFAELELDRWASLAAELLEQTDDIFTAALARGLNNAGLTPASCTWWDTARFLSGRHLAARFAAPPLRGAVGDWLADWGLELPPGLQLQQTAADVPACCIPLRIPGEVYLLSPAGDGYSAHRELLHELGHGLQLAYTNPRLSTVLRLLGDRAVGEAAALLLENLLGDSRWLRRYLSATDDSVARWTRLHDLLLLRRHCALLRCELTFHRKPGNPAVTSHCTALLQTAAGLPPEPVPLAALVSTDFAPLQYLRGRLLAAHLNTFLRREYDEDWFRNPRARDCLRDLWAMGQKPRAVEVARLCGRVDLDSSDLLAQLSTAPLG
ncbi:MAG: hypothetical protein GF399_08740 [Candidatus Coatesbacteria bacterium]|nr:hypothetical protein [Candidatus Coatesbacteria bacterium]